MVISQRNKSRTGGIGPNILLQTCTLFFLLILRACWSDSAPFPVCLLQVPEFTECDPDKPTSGYTGYEVVAFRVIAANIGWLEVPSADISTNGTSFYFTCPNMTTIDAIQLLAGNSSSSTAAMNPSCSIAAGAITVNSARLKMGVQFSMPTYFTGLGALINNPQGYIDNNQYFSFLKPFHWTVWVAIFVTSCIVPLVSWLVENLFLTGSIPYGWNTIETWIAAIHLAFNQLFFLEGLYVRAWPSMIILTCYNLMILILTCTYTANLASIITTASTAVSLSNVTSFDSLRGTTVLAYPIYVNVLEAAQGITASPFRLGQNGFFNVSDMLTSGSILAYIHDAPVLQYLTNRFAESCHLKLIPGLINPFSYGYAFSANFNYSLLSDFNAGLLLAQGEDVLDNLQSDFLTTSNSITCNTSTEQDTVEESLKFKSVAGLWIIVGSSIIFGLLASLFGIIQNGTFRSGLFYKVSKEEAREEIERIEDGGMTLVPPLLRKRALDRQFEQPSYFSGLSIALISRAASLKEAKPGGGGVVPADEK